MVIHSVVLIVKIFQSGAGQTTGCQTGWEIGVNKCMDFHFMNDADIWLVIQIVIESVNWQINSALDGCVEATNVWQKNEKVNISH